MARRLRELSARLSASMRMRLSSRLHRRLADGLRACLRSRSRSSWRTTRSSISLTPSAATTITTIRGSRILGRAIAWLHTHVDKNMQLQRTTDQLHETRQGLIADLCERPPPNFVHNFNLKRPTIVLPLPIAQLRNLEAMHDLSLKVGVLLHPGNESGLLLVSSQLHRHRLSVGAIPVPNVVLPMGIDCGHSRHSIGA